MELAEAFFAASQTGDMTALKSMLSADIVWTADGGGKRPAGPVPLVGIDAVMTLLGRLVGLYARNPPTLIRFATINGLPGYVTREADGAVQTMALDIADGRIAGIYVMRNPDKLGHVEGALLH
jgi:RNA polymerase sigma-70 factor (ECF subfamily)